MDIVHIQYVKSLCHLHTRVRVVVTTYVPVLQGSVIVGQDSIASESFHTIVLNNDKNATGVSLAAAEDNTEFVLVRIYTVRRTCPGLYLRLPQVAGEPLDQTVVQYGPFVMTSREEIQNTLMDCE